MLDAESLVQGLIGHVLKEERSMQGEVWGGGVYGLWGSLWWVLRV